MRLADILDKETVISDLKARDKRGVLEELAAVVAGRNPSLDKVALVDVLVERERLGSTGIGDGVAIPHGKLRGVKEPIVSFGRSKAGLDFESMDGEPVHLFFLLIAPENSSGVHLQVLAKIAKILKSSAFRKRLMDARTREGLYEAIIATDEES